MSRSPDCSRLCENGDYIYLPRQGKYVIVQAGNTDWGIASQNGEDPTTTCQAPQNAALRGAPPVEFSSSKESAHDIALRTAAIVDLMNKHVRSLRFDSSFVNSFISRSLSYGPNDRFVLTDQCVSGTTVRTSYFDRAANFFALLDGRNDVGNLISGSCPDEWDPIRLACEWRLPFGGPLHYFDFTTVWSPCIIHCSNCDDPAIKNF